jgi:type IV secretion system protein VirD4
MRKVKKSEVIIMLVLAVIAFVLTDRAAQLYIISGCGSDIINGLSYVFENYFTDFKFSMVFDKNVVIPSALASIAVCLAFAYYWSTQKNFMAGKEHGSARWGTAKDIKPFIDHKNPDNNIILSATEQLSLAPHMRNPLNNRNKNVVVIGGSGKGKSRFIAKPNLCQLNTSYVITDPKGELLAECGNMLAVQGGYKIKILNLEDMAQSDKFNLFAYIHTEKDILIVVDNILANTSSPEAIAHSGDDFWVKAERALLTALFAYIQSECRNEDRNINSVLDLLGVAAVREDDEDFVSPLDIMFQDLEINQPNCLACYMYNVFKLANGKTAKSILVSLGVRLAPFAIDEVRNLMSDDELDIESLGKEKTALFLIVPETYTTFNFIVCILYQLMLERLYELAKSQRKRRLQIPVQIIGDEIANIGHIPNLQRYISTMRSYGISVILIFQTLTQIEAMDKQNWKTIVGNCDTFVYLGGKEQSTNEYVSKSVGKMTIDQRQTNETKGSHGSYGMQDSTLGRDLLDPSEMEKLPGDKCIVMLSGLEPFQSKKYPLEKHPRYKYLADGGAEIFDFNRRNELMIEDYFDNTSQIISIQLDETV